MEFLTKGCPRSHPYAPMVLRIKDLCARSWEVRISHAWREGNRVADYLANLAHSMELGLHVLRHHPEGCESLLFQDIIGVSLPRLVAM